MKKLLDETVEKVIVHDLKHQGIQSSLTQLEQDLITQLKNNDTESKGLKYELGRMQQLDRIKVTHAKNSFFNPDAGTLLPSLDMAFASHSTALSQTPF